jgi:hypothetical protein
VALAAAADLVRTTSGHTTSHIDAAILIDALSASAVRKQLGDIRRNAPRLIRAGRRKRKGQA